MKVWAVGHMVLHMSQGQHLLPLLALVWGTFAASAALCGWLAFRAPTPGPGAVHRPRR